MTKGVTPEFQTVEMAIGGIRVQWQFHGEGLRGAYDPQCLDDTPLLRFTCYAWELETERWLPLKYGSYATELPVTTDVGRLLSAGRRIIEILQEELHGKQLAEVHEEPAYRERLMMMAHLSPHNFSLSLAAAQPTKPFVQ